MFVQELSDDDLNRRRDPCERMFWEFRTVSKRQRVVFSLKCAIYQSARSRNIVIWFKQNPHYCEEEEHPLPHAMVWGATNSEHLFEPYSFDERINYLDYLAMSKNWTITQMQNLGIDSNVWFQQDASLFYNNCKGIP